MKSRSDGAAAATDGDERSDFGAGAQRCRAPATSG